MFHMKPCSKLFQSGSICTCGETCQYLARSPSPDLERNDSPFRPDKVCLPQFRKFYELRNRSDALLAKESKDETKIAQIRKIFKNQLVRANRVHDDLAREMPEISDDDSDPEQNIPNVDKINDQNNEKVPRFIRRIPEISDDDDSGLDTRKLPGKQLINNVNDNRDEFLNDFVFLGDEFVNEIELTDDEDVITLINSSGSELMDVDVPKTINVKDPESQSNISNGQNADNTDASDNSRPLKKIKNQSVNCSKSNQTKPKTVMNKIVSTKTRIDNEKVKFSNNMDIDNENEISVVDESEETRSLCHDFLLLQYSDISDCDTFEIQPDLQTLDKCTGEHYKKRLLQKHSGTNATDDHFDNSTNIEDHVLNNNNNKMYRNQVQSGFESDKHVLQTAAEMQPTEKTKIKETLLNAVEFELQALNNNNSSSISSKIDGDNMQDPNIGKSAFGKHILPQIVQNLPVSRRNIKPLENSSSRDSEQKKTPKTVLNSSFSVNQLLSTNETTTMHNEIRMETDFDNNVPMNLSTHSEAIDYSTEHFRTSPTNDLATINKLPSMSGFTPTNSLFPNPETALHKVQTLRNPEELRRIDDEIRFNNNALTRWPLYQQNPNAARNINTHSHNFHPYDRMSYGPPNGFTQTPTAASKRTEPVAITSNSSEPPRQKRKYVRKAKKNEVNPETVVNTNQKNNNLQERPTGGKLPSLPSNANSTISREQMKLLEAMKRIPEVNFNSRTHDFLNAPGPSRDPSFNKSQSSTSLIEKSSPLPMDHLQNNTPVSIDGLGKDMTVYRVPLKRQELAKDVLGNQNVNLFNDINRLPNDRPSDSIGVKRGRPSKQYNINEIPNRINEYAREVARKINEKESARIRANYFGENHIHGSSNNELSSNLLNFSRPQDVTDGSLLYPPTNFAKNQQAYLPRYPILPSQYPYQSFEQNTAQTNTEFAKRHYPVPYPLNSIPNFPNLRNIESHDEAQSSINKSQNRVPLPAPIQSNQTAANNPLIPLNVLHSNYPEQIQSKMHDISKENPILPKPTEIHQSTPELRNYRISKPRSNIQSQSDSSRAYLSNGANQSLGKHINVYEDPVLGVPVLSIPEVEEPNENPTIFSNFQSTATIPKNVNRKRKSSDTLMQIDMNQIHNFEFLLQTLVHIDSIQIMIQQIKSIRSEYKNLRETVSKLSPLIEESKKSFNELMDNMISVIERKLQPFYNPSDYMDLINSFKNGKITADMFFENVIGKLVLGAGNMNVVNDQNQPKASISTSPIIPEVPPYKIGIEFNINQNPEILKSFSNNKIRICDVSTMNSNDEIPVTENNNEKLNAIKTSEKSLSKTICESDLTIVKNIKAGVDKVPPSESSLVQKICESDLKIVKDLQPVPSRSKSLSPNSSSLKTNQNVSGIALNAQILRAKTVSPNAKISRPSVNITKDKNELQSEITNSEKITEKTLSLSESVKESKKDKLDFTGAQILTTETLSPSETSLIVDHSVFNKSKDNAICDPISKAMDLSTNEDSIQKPFIKDIKKQFLKLQTDRPLRAKTLSPNDTFENLKGIKMDQTKSNNATFLKARSLSPKKDSHDNGSQRNFLQEFEELKKKNSNTDILETEISNKENSIENSIEEVNILPAKKNLQNYPLESNNPTPEILTSETLITEESSSSNINNVNPISPKMYMASNPNNKTSTFLCQKETETTEFQETLSSNDLEKTTDKKIMEDPNKNKSTKNIFKDKIELRKVDLETPKTNTPTNNFENLINEKSDKTEITSQGNSDTKKSVMISRPSIIVENKNEVIKESNAKRTLSEFPKIEPNNIIDSGKLSTVIDRPTTLLTSIQKAEALEMKCKRINEIGEKLLLNKKDLNQMEKNQSTENQIIESNNQVEPCSSNDGPKESSQEKEDMSKSENAENSSSANEKTQSSNLTNCDNSGTLSTLQDNIYAGYVHDRVYRKNVNERSDFVIRYVKDFVTQKPEKIRQIIGDPVYISDDEDTKKEDKTKPKKTKTDVIHGNDSIKKDKGKNQKDTTESTNDCIEKVTVIKNNIVISNTAEDLQESKGNENVKDEPIPLPIIPNSPTYSLVSIGSPISIVDDDDEQSVSENEPKSAKITNTLQAPKEIEKDSQSKSNTNPESTNEPKTTNTNLCNYSQISVNKDLAKFYNYKPNFQSTDNNDRIPKGKLSYNRNEGWLLRYFDEAQQILFGKNVGVENGPKNGTIFKEQRISLPRHIQFSDKEQLDDPQEYVDELNLVEKYVPLDFSSFYRYVTGYQIINKNNPISFITFLTLYNTNNLKLLKSAYIRKITNSL